MVECWNVGFFRKRGEATVRDAEDSIEVLCVVCKKMAICIQCRVCRRVRRYQIKEL